MTIDELLKILAAIPEDQRGLHIHISSLGDYLTGVTTFEVLKIDRVWQDGSACISTAEADEDDTAVTLQTPVMMLEFSGQVATYKHT